MGLKYDFDILCNAIETYVSIQDNMSLSACLPKLSEKYNSGNAKFREGNKKKYEDIINKCKSLEKNK